MCTSVFKYKKKMLTKVFFRDGKVENSLTIGPCKVIIAFFRAADGMEVRKASFLP